jgi:hypothetical protein
MEDRNIRTVLDFVEDLYTDGMTEEHILTVARNTRWKTQIEEVKRLCKKYFKS